MRARAPALFGFVLFSGTAAILFVARSTTARHAETPKVERRKQRGEWRLKSLRDAAGRIPDDAVMRAKAQLAQMSVGPLAARAAGLDSAKWTEHGPGNFGGRTRALVIHPAKPNTMLTGSVSGGIWRTTDGGKVWHQTDDLLENLAVTSIVMDPTDANVLYAGTGERDGSWGSIRGAGIFKSTNGGTKWARLASTAGAAFRFVSRLAVSPDGKVLLAAVGTAEIYRSTNGGVSWTAAFRTTGGTSSRASGASATTISGRARTAGRLGPCARRRLWPPRFVMSRSTRGTHNGSMPRPRPV